MATLTGQRIKDSYKDLLQVSNSNSGIDSTLRVISDGEATDSVLQLSTTAVNISSAGALQYAGVAITSTAAELNILDGATVTVAELNVLDGYTGSVTELNYLDTLHATGVTATEFDYLDGVTSSIQVQLDATFDTVGTGLDTSGTTISLDLNELGTETSIADADFLVMVDATDDGSQKITFENLEDAIFSSVSGDITITEAGVAAIQANSVALSTDTTGNYVGTVTAGTGLTSTGATSGEGIAHSLSVDVAQTQITSLGTLTALTVDNVSINGTTIGHTSDTDLITLADGNVTIAGELDLTTLDVSGDADIDGTLEADALTVNGTALNTVIAGVTVANATLAATTTVSDSTANTTFPVVFHDESNALLDDTGALRYNPSTGELLVPKLTVAGTTTTVDTVTMEAANAIKFEGATADANETILSIVDPTNDDNTQYLLNASGYIPLLNAVSTTVITATPTELNYVDGVTSNIQTQLDATLDTAGTGIDISSTTVSVDVSDFMANGADNRILTATGTDAMNAESSLTFDGTDLKLLGDDLEMRWGAGQDFKIYVTSDDAYLVNVREDKDIRFMVNDGNGTSGANITAIQIDASAVGQVKLPNDSQILSLGASQDLQFYHNGTNSFGADNYTGHLIFQNRADDSDIIFKTDDGSGGVTAYLTLDGSQGFTVASKNIMFTDDVQALFGNASDMVIKHDGSNNRIQGANGDMYISNYADDKDVILQTDDGSGGVTPYITLDGSATSIEIGKKMQFPASHSADKIVMYSGGNEKIGTEANTLLFTADNYKFKDTAGHDNLFMNNSGNVGIGTTSPDKKLEVSGDIKISGGDYNGLFFENAGGTTNALLYQHTANGALIIKDIVNNTDRVWFGYDGQVGIGINPQEVLDLKSSSGDCRIRLDAPNGSDTEIKFFNAGSAVWTLGHDDGSGAFRLGTTNVDSGVAINVATGGNVGIGTTSPAYKLHLEQAGGVMQQLKATDSAQSYMKFVNSTTGDGQFSDGFLFGLDSDETVAIWNYEATAMRFATSGAEKMRIDSSGRVLIGDTSVHYSGVDLQVGSTSDSQNGIQIQTSTTGYGYVLFGDGTGASAYRGQISYKQGDDFLNFITAGAERLRIVSGGDAHFDQDVIAFSTTPSDIRLKENFTKIENGLDVVSKLEGHTFNWKKGGDRLSAGFKAQEVEKILPHLVDEKKLPLKADDDKEYKILRYEEMIPYLVEAIKEQQDQINELKGIING